MHQVGSNDQCENVIFRKTDRCYLSFPGGSDGQESACNAGDSGSIPGSGRFPPEMGMATHSSILAWRIPWTEEPGELQSMGSHRVRYD